MSEAGKTVAFVVTAGLLAVAAAASWYASQPSDVEGFEKVGEEFFADFQDATAATALQVTAYDADRDRLQEFSVEEQDGRWRIPSHHGYPAEAAERLARTATSLIGLERESIVARRSNKHEEYGVVDPADPDADRESAGQRITLRSESGDILADYIIGKPAGSAAEENPSMVRDINQESDYFYVRVPDEKETYKARIRIELSTKFSDWINPDLLKLEASDINRLEIDNYELVEQNVPVGGRLQTQITKNVIDRQKLTRDGFGPWQLEGLNEETEELDTVQVDEVVSLLDTMKIVGVRPKLKLNGELLVKSDLSINEELAQKDPQMFQRRIFELQQDLENKGFTIGASENDPQSIALLGSRGELRAATSNGVLYTLYFGRSVSGDTAEIEIGAATISDDEAPADEEGGEQATAGDADSASETGNQQGEQKTTGNEEEVSGENRSRYVAIRVDFDLTALGEPPVAPTEPVKPEKPEGYDAWKEEQKKKAEAAAAEVEAGESGQGNAEQNDTSGETGQAESSSESGAGSGEVESGSAEAAGNQQDETPQPPADIQAANEEAFLNYETALQEYEQAQIQYTTDLEMYETDKAAWETREKDGRETVEELNERFAEWFYVVPAESLATLKLTRGDLVKLKETTPPDVNAPLSPGDLGGTGNQLPPAPNIRFDESDNGPPEGGSGEGGSGEGGSGEAGQEKAVTEPGGDAASGESGPEKSGEADSGKKKSDPESADKRGDGNDD
jgi:hypothetical protein